MDFPFVVIQLTLDLGAYSIASHFVIELIIVSSCISFDACLVLFHPITASSYIGIFRLYFQCHFIVTHLLF